MAATPTTSPTEPAGQVLAIEPTLRSALRRAIATDIYRVAQNQPMTLTADGGYLANALAELAMKRIETGDANVR